MPSNEVLRGPNGRVLPGSKGINPTGRPLQAPRFSRSELEKVCIEENYEPIRDLIALSRSPGASAYLQFAIHKEIAEYLYPKRKSVIIGDENGENATIHISWDNAAGPLPRKRAGPEEKQFNSGMVDAHNRVIDAVLSDEDDD